MNQTGYVVYLSFSRIIAIKCHENNLAPMFCTLVTKIFVK